MQPYPVHGQSATYQEPSLRLQRPQGPIARDVVIFLFVVLPETVIVDEEVRCDRERRPESYLHLMLRRLLSSAGSGGSRAEDEGTRIAQVGTTTVARYLGPWHSECKLASGVAQIIARA